MIHKLIQLDPRSPEVYLEVYAADRVGDYTSKAILVIPGGGYSQVCAAREGEPIALAFLRHGFNAFVLHYSVAGKKYFPGQLIEASMAMKHIKDHHEEYNIDPEQVYVVGFSAGGHLAGSLGTMWHKQEVYDAVPMPFGYNKPAGMMLIYPVISGVEKFGHLHSFYNLLGGKETTQEQLAMCSIEQNVDERTVPAFLFHTSNDPVVDVRNSLDLGAAMKAAGKTFEMHIYPDGPHGMALANQITRCGNPRYVSAAMEKWVDMAAAWTDSL